MGGELERGMNIQGADRLRTHREWGRADEANTGQVWGRQQGRANESKCRAGVEEYMNTQGKQNKNPENKLNAIYTNPSKTNHKHKPKHTTQQTNDAVMNRGTKQTCKTRRPYRTQHNTKKTP